MDKFLEKYNLPKVTQHEIKNRNSHLCIKEIKIISETFQWKKK